MDVAGVMVLTDREIILHDQGSLSLITKILRSGELSSGGVREMS